MPYSNSNNLFFVLFYCHYTNLHYLCTIETIHILYNIHNNNEN